MEIQRKAAVSRVEIKSPDRGEVAAVFSTFAVRDLDGDVVLREAVDDGAEVVISGYGTPRGAASSRSGRAESASPSPRPSSTGSSSSTPPRGGTRSPWSRN